MKVNYAQLVEIDLRYVRMYYEEPIVYLIFSANAELGFPEIRHITACAEELSNGKTYFAFSDARVKLNVTREGRRVSSDHREAPLCMGSAILVKNSMMQLAANFFNEFQKPRYPFRAFIDRQKAINWLLKL